MNLKIWTKNKRIKNNEQIKTKKIYIKKKSLSIKKLDRSILNSNLFRFSSSCFSRLDSPPSWSYSMKHWESSSLLPFPFWWVCNERLFERAQWSHRPEAATKMLCKMWLVNNKGLFAVSAGRLLHSAMFLSTDNFIDSMESTMGI